MTSMSRELSNGDSLNHENVQSPHSADKLGVPWGIRVASSWAWRLIVIALALYGLFWAGSKVSLVIISIMLAILLAALLSPAVYFFRKQGLRAGIATAITELGMIAVVVGLFALVGQQMASGFSDLSDQIATGYKKITEQLSAWNIDLGSDQLNEYVTSLTNTLKEHSSSILDGVLSVGSTAADIGTGALITLFTLIFFLMEGEKIWLFIVRLMPKAARPAVNGAGRHSWVSLGHYVRVQVLVALVDAVGIALSALFLGVPLVLPLGVLVFLGSFVPVVGVLITGSIAVLLALVANGLVNALFMLLLVLLVHQFESHILQPLIMGKAVSLHPLAVVFAVTGGSLIFGILGALFAVPVLAVINTAVRYLAHRKWEKDPDIRESEFLYPHEIERQKKKAIAEKMKERMAAAKDRKSAAAAE